MISTVIEGNEIQERSTDVRAYISPSRLNIWLRCPLAFKLRYIDGIRSPPSKSMFVGKMVHSVHQMIVRLASVGLSHASLAKDERFNCCFRVTRFPTSTKRTP